MPYTIKRSGVTLDAFISPACLKWNDRSAMYLPCGINESPQCISCVRTGQIYHVQGWAEPQTNMDTVVMEQVSQSVYEETVQQLDRGEVTAAQLQVEVEQQRADIDFALALLGADEEETNESED